MTSDNKPIVFYPCYMRFLSYQKLLINHINALDKGFRPYKTSKKHASVYKPTEIKITVIKSLLILTTGTLFLSSAQWGNLCLTLCVCISAFHGYQAVHPSGEQG